MKSVFSQKSRARLLYVLGRLHFPLVVAALCAFVFELLGRVEALGITTSPVTACLRGLLSVVPLAVSGWAIRKLPRLWQFLLVSLVLIALTWLLMGHIGGAPFALLVCVIRAHTRIAEETAPSLFDYPHMGFFLVFLAAFITSAVLDLAVTQKTSVLSAVFYLLILFLYRGVRRIDEYLLLNRDMHGLPSRRIQMVAGGAVCGVALLAALLLLPPAFGMAGDVHFDLPDFRDDVIYTPPEEQEDPVPDQASPAAMLEAMFGEDEPLPQFPPFLSYAIYAVVLLAGATFLVSVVYRVFKSFRTSYHDSRDLVQYLSADEAEDNDFAESSHRRRGLEFLDRSPNALIRRRYRKLVLKAADEPPRRWQSPREIEDWAGLTEPRLHNLYEKARYGPEPCTAADLRLLREDGRR